jgi:hypothetical protein
MASASAAYARGQSPCACPHMSRWSTAGQAETSEYLRNDTTIRTNAKLETCDCLLRSWRRVCFTRFEAGPMLRRAGEIFAQGHVAQGARTPQSRPARSARADPCVTPVATRSNPIESQAGGPASIQLRPARSKSGSTPSL